MSTYPLDTNLGLLGYDEWKTRLPDWWDNEPDEEVDCCHHGALFDEDCEWCELEFVEDEWLERMERAPQLDWIGWSETR
jgi:hypothetical protein